MNIVSVSLISIDPHSSQLVTLGDVSLRRNGRNEITISSGHMPDLVLRPGAMVSGEDADTGKPFLVRLTKAVLAAAALQGIPVMTVRGPLLHKGRKP